MTILNNFRITLAPSLLSQLQSYKKSDKLVRKFVLAGLAATNEVNLANLNYVTCPENVDFRKSVFPQLRFWMADVLTAGKTNVMTKDQVITACTFVRAATVAKISALREQYPQAVQTKVKYVECDENGVPLTEVLSNELAYEKAKRAEVSAINCEIVSQISNLKAKSKLLSTKLNKAVKACNVKDQQIKVLKTALQTVVNLSQSV